MSECFEINFDVPCGSIQGKVWGKVGGRPVVGLHGWLDNANTFDKLAPMLPEDVHFVAIDLPGHGKSSHKPLGVSTYDWVVDIKRVASQLGWKKFSMISHSMAAEYSLLYAGTFPQDVERLILLDGFIAEINEKLVEAPDVLAEHTKAMLKETAPLRLYPDLETMTLKLQQDIKELDEESAKILLARGTKQVPGGYMFTYDRHLLPPKYVNYGINYGYFRNPFQFSFDDYRSFFRRIRCQILLLKASEVASFMTLNTKTKHEELVNIIQRNSSVIIKEVSGNHYVHLNNPLAISPLVNSFLSYGKL